MRNLLLTGAILLAGWAANAQDVALDKKNNTIVIDGAAVLKYTKTNMANWSFYDMNENEIVFFKLADNGTPSYRDDDYMIINFLTENTKVESNDFSHIQAAFNVNKSIEKFVVWMLKEKVLDNKGNINPDKVATFYSKYDQNITNRTIKH